MLPSISKKIDQMSADKPKSKKKKSKKSKKVKKEKKVKKKKKKRSSSSSSDSSSEEERIRKKKKKKNFSETSSSSSDSSNADEWIEKGSAAKKGSVAKKPELIAKSTEPPKPLVREDWLGGIMLPTFSKEDVNPNPKKEVRKGIDAYDPAKSALELNPHWKGGSGGLPQFRKPGSDSEDDNRRRKLYSRGSEMSRSGERSSGWRKSGNNKQTDSYSRRRSRSRSHSRSRSSRSRRSRSKSPRRRHRQRSTSNSSSSPSHSRSRSPRKQDRSRASGSDAGTVLTDQEINDLAASQIKAQISGNTELADELQIKLEKARQLRKAQQEEHKAQFGQSSRDGDDDVLLTTTNSKGASRPFQNSESDLWGGRAGRKAKKQKVETHIDGERIRYFADDDKYNLKQMVRKRFTCLMFANLISLLFLCFSSRRKNSQVQLIKTSNLLQSLDSIRTRMTI